MYIIKPLIRKSLKTTTVALGALFLTSSGFAADNPSSKVATKNLINIQALQDNYKIDSGDNIGKNNAKTGIASVKKDKDNKKSVLKFTASSDDPKIASAAFNYSKDSSVNPQAGNANYGSTDISLPQLGNQPISVGLSYSQQPLFSASNADYNGGKGPYGLGTQWALSLPKVVIQNGTATEVIASNGSTFPVDASGSLAWAKLQNYKFNVGDQSYTSSLGKSQYSLEYHAGYFGLSPNGTKQTGFLVKDYYDATGRLIAAVDESGNSIDYIYDQSGKIQEIQGTEVYDFASATKKKVDVKFIYSDSGLQVKVYKNVGGDDTSLDRAITYTASIVDKDGNHNWELTQKTVEDKTSTTNNIQTVNFGYDVSISGITYPLLNSITEPSGLETRFVYKHLTNLDNYPIQTIAVVSQTSVDHSSRNFDGSFPTATVTYQYDNNGQYDYAGDNGYEAEHSFSGSAKNNPVKCDAGGDCLMQYNTGSDFNSGYKYITTITQNNVRTVYIFDHLQNKVQESAYLIDSSMPSNKGTLLSETNYAYPQVFDQSGKYMGYNDINFPANYQAPLRVISKTYDIANLSVAPIVTITTSGTDNAGRAIYQASYDAQSFDLSSLTPATSNGNNDANIKLKGGAQANAVSYSQLQYNDDAPVNANGEEKQVTTNLGNMSYRTVNEYGSRMYSDAVMQSKPIFNGKSISYYKLADQKSYVTITAPKSTSNGLLNVFAVTNGFGSDPFANVGPISESKFSYDKTTADLGFDKNRATFETLNYIDVPQNSYAGLHAFASAATPEPINLTTSYNYLLVPAQQATNGFAASAAQDQSLQLKVSTTVMQTTAQQLTLLKEGKPLSKVLGAVDVSSSAVDTSDAQSFTTFKTLDLNTGNVVSEGIQTKTSRPALKSKVNSGDDPAPATYSVGKTYDGFGRLKKEIFSDGKYILYGYQLATDSGVVTENGNVITKTYPNGYKEKEIVNGSGNIIAKQVNIDENGYVTDTFKTVETTIYGSDPNIDQNSPIAVTNNIDGTTVNYFYNNAHQKVKTITPAVKAADGKFYANVAVEVADDYISAAGKHEGLGIKYAYVVSADSNTREALATAKMVPGSLLAYGVTQSLDRSSDLGTVNMAGYAMEVYGETHSYVFLPSSNLVTSDFDATNINTYSALFSKLYGLVNADDAKGTWYSKTTEKSDIITEDGKTKARTLTSIDADGHTASCEYLYLGNVGLPTTATLANGNKIVYTYDAAGNKLSSTIIDAKGARVIDERTYDSLSRLKTLTLDPNGAKQLTSYSYTSDTMMKPTGMVDPNGTIFTTTFDEFNNPLTKAYTVSGGSEVVYANYVYDNITKNLTDVYDQTKPCAYSPNGGHAGIHYVYNDIGQLMAVQHYLPDSYNIDNSKFKYIDPVTGSEVTSIDLDKGKVLSLVAKDNKHIPTIVYSYYADGNPKTVTDVYGHTVSYGDPAAHSALAGAYDAIGNPLVTNYIYKDASGKLQTVPIAAYSYDYVHGGVASSISYMGVQDNAGVITVTPNGGKKDTYYFPDSAGYDETTGNVLGRTQSLIRNNSEGVLDTGVTYTYFAPKAADGVAGNIKSVAEEDNVNGNIITDNYKYDEMNRLTYDDRTVTGKNPSHSVTTYNNFDSNNNIGEEITTGDDAKDVVYTYNGLDELTGLTYKDSGKQSQTMIYDLNGNMVKDQNGTTLGYNPLNQLIKFDQTANANVQAEHKNITHYDYYPDGLLAHQYVTLDDKGTIDSDIRPVTIFYNHGTTISEYYDAVTSPAATK